MKRSRYPCGCVMSDFVSKDKSKVIELHYKNCTKKNLADRIRFMESTGARVLIIHESELEDSESLIDKVRIFNQNFK